MEKNQKLPVLGELEATDPKQIVTWAKKTLTCGKAFPKIFERINVLHLCVSKDIRDMWAALTEGVEGAPADDYPSDIDSDSKEEEELAKKRDWHYEWLETVISYYGTNQKDDVYEAIRRRVEWSNDPNMQTMVLRSEDGRFRAVGRRTLWHRRRGTRLTRRRSSRRALRCFQSQFGHCCSKTSLRMASTLGRRRPSSLTSARWPAKRTTSFAMR